VPTDYIPDLEATVARVAPRLLEIDDASAARRPAPGAWSPKEIVGHLIDSAANNHQRFVRARWQPDLVFDGYDQNAWVTAQRYQDAPWPQLVSLWRDLNLHLARVMSGVPDDVRLREHTRHNLDRIAFRTVPAERAATLDYFMRDYVEHLHHHLRQIAALLPGSID
jgi:hypothetical protein